MLFEVFTCVGFCVCRLQLRAHACRGCGRAWSCVWSCGVCMRVSTRAGTFERVHMYDRVHGRRGWLHASAHVCICSCVFACTCMCLFMCMRLRLHLCVQLYICHVCWCMMAYVPKHMSLDMSVCVGDRPACRESACMCSCVCMCVSVHMYVLCIRLICIHMYACECTCVCARVSVRLSV